ncbi:MAG: hypothetical protein PHQ75_02495 [Thermoguttaceae bacterium]|nr:hypothetical protein [Thermoguttaceae bacterium]
MYRLPVVIAIAVFSCAVTCFSVAGENETPVQSRVSSLGVFKNGVLVVQEEISFPGPGHYIWESPPAPIHGTFFLDGDNGITVTSKLRSLSLPLDRVDDFDWSRDFAGKQVRITLDHGQPFDAEVCVQGTSAETQTRRLSPYRSYSSIYTVPESEAATSEKQILLKKADGSIIVVPKKNGIASVELREGPVSVIRKRPVILFNVPGDRAKAATPTKISISYLTRGMTWAPAWKVGSEADNKIKVTQTALLVNQWRSFKDVAVFLISGYPQIAMNGVPSPLAPAVSMEYFFERLTASEDKGVPFVGAAQQVMSNAVAPSPQTDREQNLPGPSAGEGPDLVFQAVGNLTLEKNERLYLQPATKQTSYERLICWNIPDDRDELGRNDESRRNRPYYGRTTSGDMDQAGFGRFSEPWDVWQFVNPFDFPMTTGPASISDKTRFVGQTLSFWTSPGQNNSLAVNKALSLLALSKEEEVASVSEGSEAKAGMAASPAGKETNRAATVPPAMSLPDEPTKITGNATGDGLLETVRQNVGTAVLGNRLDSLLALPPGVDFKRVSTDSEGRATVVVNGHSYRIATIKATIELTNHRKEEIRSILRRRFSGELIQDQSVLQSSAKQPTGKTIVLTDKQTGINRRQEISWDFVIAPREKKVISFVYQVLISL